MENITKKLIHANVMKDTLLLIVPLPLLISNSLLKPLIPNPGNNYIINIIILVCIN